MLVLLVLFWLSSSSSSLGIAASMRAAASKPERSSMWFERITSDVSLVSLVMPAWRCTREPATCISLAQNCMRFKTSDLFPTSKLRRTRYLQC